MSVLARKYADLYPDTAQAHSTLRLVYLSYERKREASLLDAVTATAAIDALFLTDRIDSDAINPQMRRSFALLFPGEDPEERLSALNGLGPDDPRVRAIVNPWKGKYFEVINEERLNNGGEIAGISLKGGQRAVLAEDLNQPGHDLEILNEEGTVGDVLQLKATESIAYARKAIERYPDIKVVSTDEVAGINPVDNILPSGINVKELNEDLFEPMKAIFDGSLEEMAEHVLPGLPFVLIATTEGAHVLMGRQAFQQAVERGLQRGAKTGAAMAAGTLAVLAGAGVFSLPTAFLTRLNVDRYQVLSSVATKLKADRAQLLPLVQYR